MKATFSSSFKSFYKKYADFSGRSTRSEYWYAVFANTLIILLLQMSILPAGIFFAIYSAIPKGMFIAAIAGESLCVIYALVSFIPGIAVSVRRLHDIDRSGWNLLWALIPAIGTILLFVYLLTDSEAEDNRYGKNPKKFPDDVHGSKSYAAFATIMLCSVLCIGLMTYQVTGLLLYFNNSDGSEAVAKKEPGITENKNNDVDAGFQPKNEITDSPKEEKKDPNWFESINDAYHWVLDNTGEYMQWSLYRVTPGCLNLIVMTFPDDDTMVTKIYDYDNEHLIYQGEYTSQVCRLRADGNGGIILYHENPQYAERLTVVNNEIHTDTIVPDERFPFLTYASLGDYLEINTYETDYLIDEYVPY